MESLNLVILKFLDVGLVSSMPLFQNNLVYLIDLS
jgi:hypothetical protein